METPLLFKPGANAMSKNMSSIFQLSADVSGRNAETKVRGRYKEKLEEESRRKEKAAIPDEIKAKYAAWSKGEAQIKADRQKLQEDLHEMSKPLAR